MDFIDTYMQYTEPYKGSRRFRLWSAISMLSAALERRCFRSIGELSMYPNLFLCIVAKPGSGKSFAINIAKRFLDRLNQRESVFNRPGVITTSDKLTPASLIKQFARATKELGPQKYHSLYAYASELSSFILDIGGGSLVEDLLVLYNCPDVFVKELAAKHGRTVIQNLSLSLLTTTQPSFLQRFLPKEASGEGITSRLLFVADFDHHYYDRIPRRFDRSLRQQLDEQLYKVYQLKGEFTETDEAYQRLDEQFQEWHKAHNRLHGHGNFIQYHARKCNEHMPKLCMISAASSGRMNITLEDVERASIWLTDIEAPMKRIFGAQTASRDPDAVVQFLEHIPYEGIYEDELISNMMTSGVIFPHDWQLASFIMTLEKGNLLKVSTSPEGRRFFQRLV